MRLRNYSWGAISKTKMAEEIDINDEIRRVEDSFLILKKEQERVGSLLEEAKTRQKNFLKEMEICSKAVEFVEKVSTQERASVKKKVEELITSCLHEVFDDTYSVEFDYGLKRSKTSVEVYSIRKCPDGLAVKRQIDGIGGGVADAISLPLKLIVLLNDPGLDRILIVDEPGKHLSVNHVPKFAKFLKSVSKKLNIQIIMSSHHTCMDQYADSINEISLDGSVSRVERIK